MGFLNKEGLAHLWTKITNALNTKVDKVDGKGLSTNDYTTAEKNKLAGIAEGANKTIVDSTLKSDSTNPVQNKVIDSALSGKQATITGGASTIAANNLTAKKALISDANGKVAVSAVTDSELGYLNGVTSNIQTQLNTKVSSDYVNTAIDNIEYMTDEEINNICNTIIYTADEVMI